MRMLTALPDEQQARRFGAYLLAKGMPNEVEPARGGWAVWVENDDHLTPAAEELAAFRADPDAEQFRAAVPQAKEVLKRQERAERRSRARQVDVRTSWAAAAGRAAPLTYALIGACVIVALFTHLGSDREPGTIQSALYLMPPGAEHDHMGLGPVLRGQVWRLFTSIFLHFGIMHLVFNMLWLADLGGRLERLRGTLWLAALVLGTAILSNLAEHFVNIGFTVHRFIEFGHPHRAGGMSGVVYGLFGYVWIRGRLASYEPLQIHPQTTIIMLGWLVFCMTGLIGPVANTAHLVGLLCGMAIAYTPILLRRLRQ
jgi:rhomboid protease GlpG